MRRLIILIVLLIVVVGMSNAFKQFFPALKESFTSETPFKLPQISEKVKVVTEESVTIDIVKKAGPSVVTIAKELPADRPYSQFDIPSEGAPREPQGIGSGFLIAEDGLVITNKHVVSDGEGQYYVITNADKKYTVQKVYRDPLNDVAFLQITPSENAGGKLKPLELGDSSRLEVGQHAIAIGTALGEFRNTVTTGVISGLGRGITAGSPYEGAVERLDNVIQTDAAINPGNSGGPLLNSAGQVVGVNTAVSSDGQNIGFAIPINAIKDSLNNFNQTGKFERAYLGVSYRMITRDTAVMNDLPEGAYVQQIVPGSPAEKAELQRGDIITKIDGQAVTDKSQLSSFIAKKKIGDTLTITLFREDKTAEVKATLEAAPEQ